MNSQSMNRNEQKPRDHVEWVLQLVAGSDIEEVTQAEILGGWPRRNDAVGVMRKADKALFSPKNELSAVN